MHARHGRRHKINMIYALLSCWWLLRQSQHRTLPYRNTRRKKRICITRDNKIKAMKTIKEKAKVGKLSVCVICMQFAVHNVLSLDVRHFLFSVTNALGPAISSCMRQQQQHFLTQYPIDNKNVRIWFFNFSLSAFLFVANIYIFACIVGALQSWCMDCEQSNFIQMLTTIRTASCVCIEHCKKNLWGSNADTNHISILFFHSCVIDCFCCQCSFILFEHQTEALATTMHVWIIIDDVALPSLLFTLPMEDSDV